MRCSGAEQRTGVSHIDYLARTIGDVFEIVARWRSRATSRSRPRSSRSIQVAFRPVFLDMRGVFAEFGTNLPRQRELEETARSVLPSQGSSYCHRLCALPARHLSLLVRFGSIRCGRGVPTAK